MPEIIQLVTPVGAGDTVGSDDAVANLPLANPIFCGRQSAGIPDSSILMTWDLADVPAGSTINRIKIAFKINTNYTNDSGTEGLRRLGWLVPDGLWDGPDGFSVANYPTRADLPRATGDRSDVVLAGALHRDIFMLDTLKPTTTGGWTTASTIVFGTGYPEVEEQISDMAQSLTSYLADPVFNGKIGLIIDGFQMLDDLDDLRVTSSDVADGPSLTLDYTEPITQTPAKKIPKLDALLNCNPRGAETLYDFQIGADGDILAEDQLDTAFLVSLLTDQRASSWEVAEPQLRRGWVGDLENPEDPIGSKLWLLRQARLTRANITRARDWSEQCVQWLVRDDIATEVVAETEVGNDGVEIVIKVKQPTATTEHRLLKLWSKTGRG